MYAYELFFRPGNRKTDELKSLEDMIVRKPKYRPDFKAYKIGKYANGAAKYLHAFNKSERWFILISNIPDDDKMQDIIV